MDITKTKGNHRSTTVRALKERLNEVDDDLLVIFETVGGDGDPTASYTVDTVRQRGGFFVLESFD